MHFIVLGFITSLCIGAVLPSYGYILPQMMFAMVLPPDQIMTEIDFWALMMFLAALAYGVLSFINKYLFASVGSNIAKGCREDLY
jgi:hypothetical protein